MSNDQPRDPPRVTHYPKGSQPLVTNRAVEGSRGYLISEGPEQSEVRWLNGNVDVVINRWVRRVEGPQTERILVSTETGDPSKAQEGAERLNTSQRAVSGQPQDKPPKVRKGPPDNLGNQVAEYCETDDALKAFAQLNGVWDDKYLSLPNAGLRRMNIVNRLRAKAKKGHEVKWP